VLVDDDDVSGWFGDYLLAFAACCKGERETTSLLAYYGVPLLVTTDNAAFALTNDDEVVAVLQRQVDDMHAARYGHSEILDHEVTVLNSTSALYRATISRRRTDDSEISLLAATYLVTDGPAGRRFSVLAVQSA
jgi:hypothetical protein